MAQSSAQAKSPNSSQYHHFIPRFLLKNFAVFKNPGKVIPKKSIKIKSRAPRPQKLTVLDLVSGTFEQGDVGHTFGIIDMYREFDKAGHDQQKLEKELSVLESAAGMIFAQVTKDYEAGKDKVQLIRKDKDVLRRFLFIMMYRNSGFAQRFSKSREDYDSDDREHMLAYMDEKGFQSPREVWFANIRAFLEVDLEGALPILLEKLTKRAYPMDAEWFAMHIQAFFLAICTPKNTEDEFVLTQNAYGIYEGPTSAGAWTDYHRFAPVSPKIMIVLRSLLLPCDSADEGKRTMQKLLEMSKSMHPDPNRAGSWLQDLPVHKARNNYSKVVDGKIVALPTKMSEDKHVFYFPFFPLDHEHVQRINMICLENAYDTLAMVYQSPKSLRTALEFYLVDRAPGFKVIDRTSPSDPNYRHMGFHGDDQPSHVRRAAKFLPYLQLLENSARELGSTVKLLYNIVDGLGGDPIPTMEFQQDRRYAKLGGTHELILRDLHQARLIVQLIIKVDVLMRHQNGDVRGVVLQNRENLIATLPPRRVWQTVKHLRNMRKSQHSNVGLSFEKEDIIVNASHVFRADALAQIIYKVFSIDYFLHENPDYGLAKALTLDEEGAERIRQELQLVFNKPGSIRHCGITAVENAARILATQPCPGQEAMGTTFLHQVVSDEQLSELWIRNRVEKGFVELLKDELGGKELRALKDVFFHSLYRMEFGGRMQK